MEKYFFFRIVSNQYIEIGLWVNNSGVVCGLQPGRDGRDPGNLQEHPGYSENIWCKFQHGGWNRRHTHNLPIQEKDYFTSRVDTNKKVSTYY